MLTVLLAKATLWPRLPYGQGYLMGARCYALNVDGFMGQGYLMAKAIIWPRLEGARRSGDDFAPSLNKN